MVEGGDQVAVARQLLRPGGVLGPHPARPRGEQDDREPFSPTGHRGVEDRTAASPRDAVDQEAGQADPAGEGLGDGARLLLRASQVLSPLGAGWALLRGVPELGHDRAPVVRIGGEAFGAERVGPLRHPGAHREAARRLGELGHGEGPSRHRAGGDQTGAGQRSRQGQPPAGPPRRSAGTASQQGREGERRRQGGAGQDRQLLPADPHHAQPGRGRHEHRPRPDRDGPAGGRGSQRAATSARAPSRTRTSGRDIDSPVMVSVTRPCSAPGPRRRIGPGSPPVATPVATRAGRGATGVATGHARPAAALRPREVVGLLLRSYTGRVRSDRGLMRIAAPEA